MSKKPSTARLIPASKQREVTGLPYSTVRDAALAGLIPVVRMGLTGRRWYFDLTDLHAFIEKRKERLGHE